MPYGFGRGWWAFGPYGWGFPFWGRCWRFPWLPWWWATPYAPYYGATIPYMAYGYPYYGLGFMPSYGYPAVTPPPTGMPPR